jgi:hypothetical protein
LPNGIVSNQSSFDSNTDANNIRLISLQIPILWWSGLPQRNRIQRARSSADCVVVSLDSWSLQIPIGIVLQFRHLGDSQLAFRIVIGHVHDRIWVTFGRVSFNHMWLLAIDKVCPWFWQVNHHRWQVCPGILETLPVISASAPVMVSRSVYSRIYIWYVTPTFSRLCQIWEYFPCLGALSFTDVLLSSDLCFHFVTFPISSRVQRSSEGPGSVKGQDQWMARYLHSNVRNIVMFLNCGGLCCGTDLYLIHSRHQCSFSYSVTCEDTRDLAASRSHTSR